MHDFTPWSGLIGGALIGLGASVLLVANGRIAVGQLLQLLLATGAFADVTHDGRLFGAGIAVNQ